MGDVIELKFRGQPALRIHVDPEVVVELNRLAGDMGVSVAEVIKRGCGLLRFLADEPGQLLLKQGRRCREVVWWPEVADQD